LYTEDPIFRIAWNDITPSWRAQGRWENDLHHAWEADRGYTSTEDAFVPGSFSIDWNGEEDLSFSLEIEWEAHAPVSVAASDRNSVLPADWENEKFVTRLRPAAQAYSTGIREADSITPSLIAGFPWFGPWGRDTMISLPGYALATNRTDQAFAIMSAMGRRIREALHAGLVGGPNLSHRVHAAVNLHGVDTPLLFIWALEKLDEHKLLNNARLGLLREIACEILDEISRGAFPGVEVTVDGMLKLAAGHWAPTWMDARLEERAVTPRHGSPIEINALFANGLSYLKEREDHEARLPRRLREAADFLPKELANRYWRTDLGYFCDTLGDGADDFKLRPNQLWLMALNRIDVDPAHAKRALQMIKQELLTPVGLRTLSPRSTDYKGRCEGDQKARDLAYHQGTVWPWLLGVFADALLRFEGVDSAKAILGSTLTRLEAHTFGEGCIGHVSEIFDGDEPFHARGAPAQAWSVMELYRLLAAMEAAQS
jgi:predicted glycogen debranching enzyme